MKGFKSQKGLTVIELIVVIGMLSLLFSIVLLKIDTSNYKLLQISKSLRDDIRYIRYVKMTEGENYRIYFQRDKYTIIKNNKIIKKVNLNNEFSIYQNFKGNNIFFSFNGAPSTSGGTIKIVNNRNGKYMKITVVPGTGRILMKNQIFN